VSLLAIAQLLYNNKLSEVTGTTPYFANYRIHLYLFERTLPGPKAEAVIKNANEIKALY
jgi:hypothetical protein